MEMQMVTGQVDGPNLESSKSGIHWASVLGGATTAAAISLILIPLGSALGFSSFSVFTATSENAFVFTAGCAIWLIVMQWVSSFVGGYIAGRLRVKWADTHSDEVFFRDTAHGFIAWAVATLLTVGVLASVASTTVSGLVNAGSSVAASTATSPAARDQLRYFVDGLYRGAKTDAAPSADVIAETSRIIAIGTVDNRLSADDRAYLAQQVALRTGLTEAEAQARVDKTLSQIEAAKKKAANAAEAARKTVVSVSIVLFLSLIIGAFIASVSAALGGRLRDAY
jgi:hypothetical protein